MKKIILLCIAAALIATQAFTQIISLSDSTVTFKNREGKVLTKEEVQQLMKGTFSLHQENVNGKKTITILPASDSSRIVQMAKIESFKRGLVDQPLPSFSFKDVSGNKWKSRDLKGKIVVINFWFTSCKPCIQEMPLLNELVSTFKDSAVVFLAPAPEDVAQIKKFLTKYPFDYSIIPSSSKYIDELKIENFPTHIIASREGTMRFVTVGYDDNINGKLTNEINKLLLR